MVLDKVKLKTINNNSLIGDGNITVGGSSVDIVTSWENTLSDTKVPSEKLSKNTIDLKVAIAQGSGNANKNVVTDNSGNITIEAKPTIPSKVSDLTNDSGFITSSSLPTKVSDLQNDTGFITSSALPTKTSDLTNDGDGTNAFLTQHQSLANYVQKSSTSGLLKNDGSIDTTSYSTFSGSYNDLSNKPSIPSSSSDLSDGSSLVKTSSTTGLIKNDGSIDTNTYLTQHQDLSTWTSQTIATYGTLYVNTALRLCEFKYFRTNYQFSNTSEVTLHSGAIPSAYRPKQTIICAVYQVSIIGAVTTAGNIVSITSSTGTKTINMSAFWHY